MSKEEVTTEIERYFVYPGQACSYMVGCQSILTLREKAQRVLGDRFDLKEFHDGKIDIVECSFDSWRDSSGSTPWSLTIGYAGDHHQRIHPCKNRNCSITCVDLMST
jgi:hypothetical protein